MRLSKIIFIALLLYTSHYSYAQELSWVALNNCGSLFRVNFADTDTEGNCYIVGEYRGEVEINSGSKSQKSNSWYSSTMGGNFQTALVKYLSSGELDFTVRIISRGGFVLPNIVKCLSNGDVALLLYADVDYLILSPNDTIEMKAARYTTMLRFNSQGELVWNKNIEGKHPLWLLEDAQEKLYLYKNKTYFDKAVIKVLDASGKELEEIAWHSEQSSSPVIFENKIWFDKKLSGRNGPLEREAPDSLGFFTLDLKSRAITQQFSLPYWVKEKYHTAYGFSDGQLEINLWAPKIERTLNLNERTYDKGDSGFVAKFSEKGILKASTSTPPFFYYNKSISADSKGNVFLIGPAADNFSWDGQPAIEIIKHSNPYIQELYVAKLNSKLELDWVIPGGGTASNSHKSIFIPGISNKHFLISDLLDYGTMFGNILELKWSSGWYVLKIEDE